MCWAPCTEEEKFMSSFWHCLRSGVCTICIGSTALWAPSRPVSPLPDAADWADPWAAPTACAQVRRRGHGIAQRSSCRKDKADRCHGVSLILSYHARSLMHGRNLSLFNYEKEEFVPVKSIWQKCSDCFRCRIIFFYQVTAISLLPNVFWWIELLFLCCLQRV